MPVIWLISRLVVWPVKATYVTGAVATRATAKTAAGSAKLGFRAGRLVGYRRFVVLAIGVGIGMLLAPVTGEQLRRKLRQRFEERFGAAPASTPPSRSSNGQGAWQPAGAADDELLGDQGTNPAP